MQRRSWISTLVLGFFLLTGSHAVAEDHDVRGLRGQQPPEASAVQRAIQDRTAEPAAPRTLFEGKVVEVELTPEQQDRGVQGFLRVEDPDGTRMYFRVFFLHHHYTEKYSSFPTVTVYSDHVPHGHPNL